MSSFGTSNCRPSPQAYSVFSVVLPFLGRTLEDFVGSENGEFAKKVIGDYSEETRLAAVKKVKEAAAAFGKLSPDEQKLRLENSSEECRKYVKANSLAKIVKCPACSAEAVVRGDVTGRGEPALKDNDLVVEARVLPIRFGCPACGLKLATSGELNHMGIGEVYTRPEHLDVMEFFGIDPHEYIDESEPDLDYAND